MITKETRKFVDEVSELMIMRLLWAVLPARHSLRVAGMEQLGDIVTWAIGNVSEDIATIFAIESVESGRRSERRKYLCNDGLLLGVVS